MLTLKLYSISNKRYLDMKELLFPNKWKRQTQEKKGEGLGSTTRSSGFKGFETGASVKVKISDQSEEENPHDELDLFSKLSEEEVRQKL